MVTSIPREIENLVNLKILYFITNNLTSIPRELGNMVNLDWLSLASNELTSIPRELANLVNLRTPLPYPIKMDFYMTTGETIDRVVGANTFSDLGRLCARFF